MPIIWEDEILSDLKKLWNTIGEDGSPVHSARQIAVLLSVDHGLHISKNAVIGAAHRNNLAIRDPKMRTILSVRAHKENRRPRRVVPRVYVKKVKLAPSQPAPQLVVGGVPFMDLKSHHCRATLDGRGPDGLPLYCGAVCEDQYSFCVHHRGIFTVPPRRHGRGGTTTSEPSYPRNTQTVAAARRAGHWD